MRSCIQGHIEVKKTLDMYMTKKLCEPSVLAEPVIESWTRFWMLKRWSGRGSLMGVNKRIVPEGLI